MTRTFLWVLATVGLVAGSIFGARHFARNTGDGTVHGELQALRSEMDQLRDELARRDRADGQTAGRLALSPQLVAAPPVKETPEEEEARVEREGKAQAIKEAEYYARLDREMRLARPASEPRAQMQKNIEALAAGRVNQAPLAVDKIECAESLCRLEVRRLGPPNPNAVTGAVRLLSRGMAELTMRPFDNDRSVIYAAPQSHKLPPLDL